MKKDLYIGIVIGLILMILSLVISYFKDKKLKEFERTIKEINRELSGKTNLVAKDGKVINQKNDTIVLLSKNLMSMQQRITRLKNNIIKGEIEFSVLDDSVSVLRDLTNQYTVEVDRATREAIDSERVTTLCDDNSLKKAEFEIEQAKHEELSEAVRNLPTNCK